MRSVSLAAACVAAASLLVVTAAARAEDDPRSPLGAFDKAQEGDWTAYSGTFENEKLHERQKKVTALWRVEKVTDREVVVVQHQRLGSSIESPTADTQQHTFSRKDAPSVLALLDVPRAKPVKVTTEGKVVTIVLEGDGQRVDLSVAFSADLKVPGISKLEMKGSDGSVLLLEAKGTGNKDKTLWGSPADEVVGAAMAGGAATDRRLACPKCGAVARDQDARKCPKDGAPLVRSDLIALHSIILELGKKHIPMPGGHDNPFHGLVKKDGTVDIDALEKLVAEYKALAKKIELPKNAKAALGGGVHANEASAIGALRTLCTCQAIFREGDKDQNNELDYGDLAAIGKAKLCDSVLASGKKQGYVFVCEPGRDPSDKDKDLECRTFFWYATATPETPGETGERYFFTNQTGVIYYSTKPFEVTDKKKCEPPAGVVPVGK